MPTSAHAKAATGKPVDRRKVMGLLGTTIAATAAGGPALAAGGVQDQDAELVRLLVELHDLMKKEEASRVKLYDAETALSKESGIRWRIAGIGFNEFGPRAGWIAVARNLITKEVRELTLPACKSETEAREAALKLDNEIDAEWVRRRDELKVKYNLDALNDQWSADYELIETTLVRVVETPASGIVGVGVKLAVLVLEPHSAGCPFDAKEEDPFGESLIWSAVQDAQRITGMGFGVERGLS